MHGAHGGFTKTALLEFAKILLFGTTFGFTFAHGLNLAINKKWIPHYLLNVFAFLAVVIDFVENLNISKLMGTFPNLDQQTKLYLMLFLLR